MKLIQIAGEYFYGFRGIPKEEELKEAIVEAEVMERKAKAFDWLMKQEIEIRTCGVPKSMIFRGGPLEAVEAAMKEEK